MTGNSFLTEGGPATRSNPPRIHVPIFYYHSVGGPPPQTLALDLFRQHLECVRRHACTTVTVAELLERGPRPGQVALTFDDGLLDNYVNVFPLLQELGMRATFFVVPGYDRVTRWVHPGTGRWSDVPGPGFSIAFQSMQSQHRQELVRHGMEIGSHTLTHRKLTWLQPEEARREIADSKRFLEDELGRPVSTFCYPNGRFNLRILQEVRRAGYRGACSTIPGYPGYRFLLQRFLVEDPVYFEAVVRGRAFHPGPLLGCLFRRLGRLWSNALPGRAPGHSSEHCWPQSRRARSGGSDSDAASGPPPAPEPRLRPGRETL